MLALVGLLAYQVEILVAMALFLLFLPLHLQAVEAARLVEIQTKQDKMAVLEVAEVVVELALEILLELVILQAHLLMAVTRLLLLRIKVLTAVLVIQAQIMEAVAVGEQVKLELLVLIMAVKVAMGKHLLLVGLA
jgi:hypothetical protein